MKTLITIPDRQPRPSPLARGAFAKLRAKATICDLAEITKTMRGGDEVLRVMTTKSSAPVATTADPGFAAELAPSVFGDFLTWLAPDSAAARIIDAGLNFPIRGADFRAPARDTAPAALPWVGESMPIPVRSMTLHGVSMTPRKMSAMSVISREVAKFGGEAAIVAMLREDAAKSLDAGYFSTATGDAVIHPGLLAGVAAIAGYSGGDLAAFEHDVAALLEIVAPNGSGNIVFVTGAYAVQKIALKFPDFRSPVYASSAVSDTRLIAIDAGALVHSFGDFDIDVSVDAVVHMENETPSVDVGGSTGSVRSLYQTDSYGVRILGDIAFAGRKANVAAFVEAVTW